MELLNVLFKLTLFFFFCKRSSVSREILFIFFFARKHFHFRENLMEILIITVEDSERNINLTLRNIYICILNDLNL